MIEFSRRTCAFVKAVGLQAWLILLTMVLAVGLQVAVVTLLAVKLVRGE